MKQLNLCRCCLAVGSEKDISKEYEENGRKEVYSDMLLETFNIFISYEDMEGKCQICDNCIARLRDATEFKAQVVEAGKAIAQKLKNPDLDTDGDVFLEDNVKMEVYEEVELDYSEFDLDAFAESNQDDEIYIIKLEEDRQEEEPAPIMKQDLEIPPIVKKKRRKVESCFSRKEKSTRTKPEVTQKHLEMRTNSLKLVRNSNMCLFKAGKTKFGCFYCYESYTKIEELREHSKTHSHTKELVIKINPVSGLAYKKADISSLHCNRCLEPCEDLAALQEHLTFIHEFTFTDAGHLLIPFKLEKGYICCICDITCNTFTYLSMHMNSHFPNYVCETCGAAYINFKNLDIHRRVVHLRKCKKCESRDNCTCKDVKIIKTNTRICVECNIVFKYSYLLKEHNYQVHGAERPIATCEICNKMFLTPNNLNLHIRRIHNAERNHVCKLCDMKFFTSHGMKKHIRRTHTEVEIKPYSCGYCSCKFKMKYSLSKHLKNRHGRRMDGSLFEETMEVYV